MMIEFHESISVLLMVNEMHYTGVVLACGDSAIMVVTDVLLPKHVQCGAISMQLILSKIFTKDTPERAH